MTKTSEIPAKESESAWKDKPERPSQLSVSATESEDAKLRNSKFLSLNPGNHLMEYSLYSNAATSTAQLLSGGIPSMTMHTSPVALHLLSSYIAAGYVPQIPGSAALLSGRTGFDRAIPTTNLQTTPGVAFQSVASLMTTSASSNNLHSQPISTGTLAKIGPPSCLNAQDFGLSLNSTLSMPAHNGFPTNVGINMDLSSSGIGTNDARPSGPSNALSNDIKRPIPHLPHKNSGVGIL